jgi:hypothetical protein
MIDAHDESHREGKVRHRAAYMRASRCTIILRFSGAGIAKDVRALAVSSSISGHPVRNSGANILMREQAWNMCDAT